MWGVCTVRVRVRFRARVKARVRLRVRVRTAPWWRWTKGSAISRKCPSDCSCDW